MNGFQLTKNGQFYEVLFTYNREWNEIAIHVKPTSGGEQVTSWVTTTSIATAHDEGLDLLYKAINDAIDRSGTRKAIEGCN
jgi:hypothetical protein